MPRLSIVMPFYNTENFIKETIESLLNQTFKDFELIVVDDGSTDKSPEIISSFKDPRIKLIQNEQRKGIVYSRNKGLSEANGEFYAPFDSDDIALPHKFERQIQFLQDRQTEGRSLSRARSRLPEHICARQCDRYHLFLNFRRRREIDVGQRVQQRIL